MTIDREHQQVHEILCEFGPMPVRDVARRAGLTVEKVSALMRALSQAGHVERIGLVLRHDRRGVWWQDGPVPLPETLGRSRGCTADLFDRARQASLNPVQDPGRGWRVSVPHPLGERGRVWLDSLGDLEAVLLDRDRAEGETREVRAA